MDEYQEFLLKILEGTAREGTALPDGSFAWSRLQTLSILEELGASKIAVIAGEFFRVESVGIVPAFDGWECARISGESAADYALRSRELARWKVNLEEYAECLVVLDFSDQQSAA